MLSKEVESSYNKVVKGLYKLTGIIEGVFAEAKISPSQYQKINELVTQLETGIVESYESLNIKFNEIDRDYHYRKYREEAKENLENDIVKTMRRIISSRKKEC